MTSPREFQDLVQKAKAVRSAAHAPYSSYKVGAALLSTDGRIFTGVNVENSAYPTCICAETCALGSAVAAGATDFVAIAIVTDPPAGQLPGAPCGNCRQALSEFSLDMSVVLASVSGEVETLTLRELLPRAFSSEDL